MIERAEGTTPEELLCAARPAEAGGAGGPGEVPPLSPGAGVVPEWSEPGSEASRPRIRRCRPTRGRARARHPNPGEDVIEVDGKRFRKGGKVVLRPDGGRDVYDKMLDGRIATIERIYFDYDGRCAHRGHDRRRPVPESSSARPAGYLFFKGRELETLEAEEAGEPPMSAEPSRAKRHVLVAGIGNAWMADDGFGGKVAKVLGERELPEGVAVFDFGTGGLDLAYEVMRGYDALVLVDVSRQGGEPGTLVRDRPRPGGDRADRGRRGDQPARDGPEDRAALRQDGRRLARQGRRRRLRALGGVEEMGLELSEVVAGAVERAAGLVIETVAELLTDEAYADDAAAAG